MRPGSRRRGSGQGFRQPQSTTRNVGLISSSMTMAAVLWETARVSIQPRQEDRVTNCATEIRIGRTPHGVRLVAPHSCPLEWAHSAVKIARTWRWRFAATRSNMANHVGNECRSGSITRLREDLLSEWKRTRRRTVLPVGDPIPTPQELGVASKAPQRRLAFVADEGRDFGRPSSSNSR